MRPRRLRAPRVPVLRVRARSAEGEHSLLAEYHDGLSEGGVTAYSMYDAWEDYRAGVVYALVGAVAAAGAPGLEADAQAWCVLQVPLLTYIAYGSRRA